MKKFYILSFALLMVGGTYAQPDQLCSSCLPEGITFTTQAQIDNFQTDFPNCTRIEGDVTIRESNITNLNGLSVITSIGGRLGFYFNESLTSLTGLENLTSIGGYVYINYNNALTSLTGLENLTSIGGFLSISSNSALTSLTGLENLTSIGGYLAISNNSALTSLTGLESLTSIGGDLTIESNYSLTSLSGLENLTSIQGLLRISLNSALTSLNGMNNVTFVGDEIGILYNHALTSLTGLESLTVIGDYLKIESNNSLTSLAGLENIEASSINGLYLWGNSSLSTCEVQSICDYLAAPNGTVYIGNNATGCNSDEEVIAACMVGVEESAVGGRRSAVNLYPNPASSAITVELPHFISNKNTSMTIYTIGGQQIISHRITEQNTVVDLSGLNAGVYFVRVVSDDGVSVGKVVKR